MVKLNLPRQIFTDRLFLQKLRYEEAEEIFYSYASKPEATRFMSWPTHQSLADTQSFLRFAMEGWKDGSDYSYSIRLQKNARFIGSFGIVNEYGRIQFGYILSPSQWGNGYATEVCTHMMQLLRTLPGVVSIQTFIDSENSASARVLIKSGLIEEARLSNWFRFVNQENRVKDCTHYRFPL